MKEKKVYVVSMDQTKMNFGDTSKKEAFGMIMDEAERIGSVYSLWGFECALNNMELDLGNSFIHIE